METTGWVGQAGGRFEGVVEPLINAFTREHIGGFLALCIFVAFVLLIAATAWWFVRGRREIGRAAAIIARAGGSNERERRAAFAQQFTEIDSKLGALGRIGPCWREFRETLETPEVAGPDAEDAAKRAVRKEKRPQTYFTLSNAGMAANVLRSMPGVLVGVGLVLTFAGLIAALAVAAQGLGSATGQDGMKNVLGALLGTAGAKFYASATALGCSIALGLLQRSCLSALSRRMHRVNDLLEERLRFDAMASTSRQQLAVMREQHEQLKRFNGDFALKVGEAVRGAFDSSNVELVSGLSNVAAKLDALADKTSANISQTVGDKLDGALSETLATMDATLRDVQGSLGRLPDEIGEAVGALSQASNDMGDALRRGADDGARAMNARLDGEMTEVVAALRASVETMRESGSAIGDRTRAAGDVAGAAIERAGQASADQLSEQTQALALQLRGVSEPLIEAVGTMRSSSDALGREVQALIDATETLRTALSEGADAHRAAAENVGSAASELREVAATNGRVANDNRALIEATTRASERLASTSEGMTAGMEVFHATIKQLRDETESSRNGLNDGRQHFETIIQ